MPLSERSHSVAGAVARVRALLEQRPGAGLHADAPATAAWQGSLAVRACHPGGFAVETDMPAEIGGAGAGVTPGWLFRAGLASCAASVIALTAAAEGIALEQLEVTAESRSDTRGLLGMTGADGAPVPAGALDLHLFVRIAAANAAPERLTALVERCQGLAPVGAALREGRAISLSVAVGARRDAA
jgi:uncharacterized OsmC-like protein